MEHAPDVQLIWNIFPLTLLVWAPVRFLGNLFFFPIYAFLWWVPAMPNFIFETMFILAQIVGWGFFFMITFPLNIIPFYFLIYIGEFLTINLWN